MTADELLIRCADKLREPEQNVFRHAHAHQFPNHEVANYKHHWDTYLRDGRIPHWVTAFCVRILEEP